MRYRPIFEGIGIALIVIGLAFCFFSSYHMEGSVPTATVLSVIGHYLEGIAIGIVSLAVGVLTVVLNRYSVKIIKRDN